MGLQPNSSVSQQLALPLFTLKSSLPVLLFHRFLYVCASHALFSYLQI